MIPQCLDGPDCLGGDRWLLCRGIAEPLADLERMAAQCLGARARVDRQHVLQQVSRDSIRQQC
jgi:hypothetical protein